MAVARLKKYNAVKVARLSQCGNRPIPSYFKTVSHEGCSGFLLTSHN